MRRVLQSETRVLLLELPLQLHTMAHLNQDLSNILQAVT